MTNMRVDSSITLGEEPAPLSRVLQPRISPSPLTTQARWRLGERGGKCRFAAGEEAQRAPLLLMGVHCSRWMRGRGGGLQRDGRAVHG